MITYRFICTFYFILVGLGHLGKEETTSAIICLVCAIFWFYGYWQSIEKRLEIEELTKRMEEKLKQIKEL